MYHKTLKVTATLSSELQRQDLTIVDVRDKLNDAMQELGKLSITQVPDTEDQETEPPPGQRDEEVTEDQERFAIEEKDLPFHVQKIKHNIMYLVPVRTKGPIKSRVKDLQNGTESAPALDTVQDQISVFKVKEVEEGKEHVKEIKSLLIPKITEKITERLKGLDSGIYDYMSLIMDHHR